MSTDWTPFDFILHGEFAGTDHLRDIVGRVRVATNSVCSLSIIYQAGESFQSLMYVRHEEPGQENALQAGLASYSLTRDDRNSIEELLKAPRVDRLPRLLDRSARRLFEGICEAFGDVTPHLSTMLCGGTRNGIVGSRRKKSIPLPAFFLTMAKDCLNIFYFRTASSVLHVCPSHSFSGHRKCIICRK